MLFSYEHIPVWFSEFLTQSFWIWIDENLCEEIAKVIIQISGTISCIELDLETLHGTLFHLNQLTLSLTYIFLSKNEIFLCGWWDGAKLTGKTKILNLTTREFTNLTDLPSSLDLTGLCKYKDKNFSFTGWVSERLSDSSFVYNILTNDWESIMPFPEASYLVASYLKGDSII